jgi:truncated hemoglobin YjbI
MIAVGVVLLASVSVHAQDTSAQDRLLADALKEMHNKAADLYNGGDPNGCYRMFQGGLLTARSLLGHRPDLQQAIDQGLQAADQQASIALRARALHDTIESVRTKLKPPAAAKPAEPAGTPTPSIPQTPPPPPSSPANPPPVPPAPMLPMVPPVAQSAPIPPMNPPAAPPVAATDTLWKRLGGENGITKIVDDWLTWAIANKNVNFSRGDKYKLDAAKQKDLQQKFVAYISSISDGTVVPTTTRGMSEVHKGMNITAAEFDAFVEQLKAALQKNNVAAKDVEELLRKVNGTRKDIVGGGG